MNFWCINYLADDMNKSYLERLPIRTIDFSNPTESSLYNTITSHVQRMMELQKRLTKSQLSQEQTLLKRQIEMIDQQIDKLVYELYGLPDEEIAIVEAAGWVGPLRPCAVTFSASSHAFQAHRRRERGNSQCQQGRCTALYRAVRDV